ncbi:MAG: ABC transporter permease [Candidatus Woesearchaeota archaeon]
MELKKHWISFSTIVRKEVIRFSRIWTQTLLPPVITQSLYFIIFGGFIGSQISDINGISYMAFIIPGLIMMTIINNSYSNVVSSFFGAKFQRSIEELMVSPTSNWTIIAGYSTGGILRALITGFLVYLVAIFFAAPQIYNLTLIIVFAVLTALVFALAGLINSIFATKFDDIAIIPTFVLTPLTYLGGVFYSIKDLPEFWQKVSMFNPILYMVDGLRFGFYGQSDFSPTHSLLMLLIFSIILLLTSYIILKKGYGLKS